MSDNAHPVVRVTPTSSIAAEAGYRGPTVLKNPYDVEGARYHIHVSVCLFHIIR
jgi:hypothetical protein